jgi:hypothetical protein
MFEAVRMPDESPASSAPRSAVTGRFVQYREGAGAPKRDRRVSLTRVSKRGRLGQRIAELRSIFTEAVVGEISPMRRMRIAEAAELKALAEKARGDYLRDGVGDLDDIIRAERRADQAVRAIGIVEAKRRPPSLLADHFSRPPVREAAE